MKFASLCLKITPFRWRIMASVSRRYRAAVLSIGPFTLELMAPL